MRVLPGAPLHFRAGARTTCLLREHTLSTCAKMNGMPTGPACRACLLSSALLLTGSVVQVHGIPPFRTPERETARVPIPNREWKRPARGSLHLGFRIGDFGFAGAADWWPVLRVSPEPNPNSEILNRKSRSPRGVVQPTRLPLTQEIAGANPAGDTTSARGSRGIADPPDSDSGSLGRANRPAPTIFLPPKHWQ